MKKTLIALLALSGIAMAAEPAITLTLPESGLLGHGDYFQGNTGITSVFNKVKGYNVGAYAGNNGGKGPDWTDTPGTEGYWSGDTGTITLAGRSGTQGESFALVLNNSINVGQLISSVSFSGTVEAGSNINNQNIVFSVGIFDGSNQVAVADAVTITGSSTDSKDFAVTLTGIDPYEWTATSKVIAVLAGPGFAPPAGIYNVSGIQVTATMAAPVPEPTTGSLSLLALAGLCIRRRK